MNKKQIIKSIDHIVYLAERLLEEDLDIEKKEFLYADIAIERHHLLKAISESTTELDTSKANLNIGCVSKRLFTLKEAQEMYFAGYINPFSEKELLEKDKNGMSVKFLETVKRCYY